MTVVQPPPRKEAGAGVTNSRSLGAMLSRRQFFWKKYQTIVMSCLHQSSRMSQIGSPLGKDGQPLLVALYSG